MSLGQVIKEVRKARGLSQTDLGIPYGQSMIGRIERDERRVAPDIAPILVDKLDHPAVSITAMHEMTGGVGPVYLNGDNVDLHRSSVRERCLHEMSESMDAIQRFHTSKPPERETERERNQRKEHLLEVLDSIVHEYMYVAVQCEEYGFSFKELHNAHYAKLRSLRLVQEH
ncbi:helix-turn-helix domain-containing protein [Alicyclobacillus fastidiosus]|uniref:Helix-turn-helix domain-containing protein n=1 Tax=Alicyclobacillus fastidiosus TaxID=392011 RepID=A0ABY6ZIW1_9BACL|nr:helix-turn-helix transcriptional regulator [Alicyclobacillus fastidiosus]WAH42804.1 helix-turn-helix domain-containing protein [Alicyclobacillus fastidiosus]GMA64725.1 hypothetical protein GCM10025859_51650 [Alicyclobacillus fastidiosus]